MNEQYPILSVHELNISFVSDNTFTAVKDLSFHLEKGKTLTIVGESGSGKSLTALALMGLLPKNAMLNGTIKLNNQALTNISRKHWQQIRGKEIGMIFQEPMSSLNPVMKIGHQLSEAIRTHQPIPAQHAKRLSIEWLRKVQLPAPEKIYDRYPHQLSGGQKQRVMIAMAMCNAPSLLIADEPTTALDVTVQQEIIKLMQQLQQETHTSMIFITHDLALASLIADDVLVLYRGEKMEYGRAEQILKQPAHPYTQALLACRPSAEQKHKKLPVVADFLEADKSKSAVLITDIPRKETIANPETLLSVNNLRIWFPEKKDWLGRPKQYFKAVDEVSFELKKGEVLGLVGESGCGKSTLGKSLIGLLPVREGQIIFEGKDLSTIDAAGWRQVRKDIQMIFQDPYSSLNPRMTVGDMLIEPLIVHQIVPKKEWEKEAKRLLDLVHLPKDSLKRYPHQFSGGQRQRLGIARALALRPKLLLCDESVSALDVSIQAQILNLLKELQQEFQLSYLFISHDLNVVHYISDRVMVMHAGRIVESGEAEKVLLHPEDEYTKKLLHAVVSGF